MHGTTISNITQTFYPNFPTPIPVIPGKQVYFKTKEEQVVKHYDELIIAIMKVMDIQYITHCTDSQYQLITIHGAGNTLIHMVPSKTLQKQLLTRKEQQNSIKTRAHCVKQLTILTNGVMHYRMANLINK